MKINCADIDKSSCGQQVIIKGWVHRRRDHGGVIFLDVRDRSGLFQIVINPLQEKAFKIADQLRSEYVIKAIGKVRERPAGNINQELSSGTLELETYELEILNQSLTPPFPLDEFNITVGENVRLQHRYIDLRRPQVQQKLIFRAKLISHLRKFLEERNFLDIETPYLTKATPEGARDYVVPSRVHPSKFYALPQSPQIFKQLLMMSGFEKYYQIVRCFRDEDLRADRQPEFTQLDIETSFLEQEDIILLMEEMLKSAFQLIGVELSKFPRLSYKEVISLYGVDKPDLRIPLELVDIADIVKNCGFKVFTNAANEKNSRVACIRAPGGCSLSRKELDDYIKYVKQYGAKGLAYIKVNDVNDLSSLQSPIVKFLDKGVLQNIINTTKAESGDVLFFGADIEKIVNDSLGALRVKLGHDLNLVSREYKPLWVYDFPMFEQDSVTLRKQAMHHPFTAPNVDSAEQLLANPVGVTSKAYDLVINGYEIGGGSIRVHKYDMQLAVLRTLGIAKEEAHEKFGHLLNGLRYGCPPHGGIAFGIDRLAMIMTNASSIREVIAFPKTQTASCPLTDAPATITNKQLVELNISTIGE